MALYHAETAADILESQPHVAFIEFVKIRLDNTPAIVVDAEVEFVGMHILGEVDEAGAAVFQDIVDQFLHDAEDDKFFFSLEPVFVLMKATAGVDAAGSADFLKEIVDG